MNNFFQSSCFHAGLLEGCYSLDVAPFHRKLGIMERWRLTSESMSLYC